MTHIVANGNAYSDDGSSSRDMQGGGFRQWLLPMLGDTIVQTAGDAGAAANAKDIAASAAQAAGDSAAAASDFADLAQAAFAQADAIGSGWSPQVQLVPDGVRVVMQVTDWVGGKGPKPGIGYVGPAGLVAAIADGTNLRGAVAYSDLPDKPTLGTAAALDVPVAPATAATAAQVVRGDDPRLAGGSSVAGSVYLTASQTWTKPPGIAWVLVELLAGGASGGAAVSTTSGSYERVGGEGGEYVQRLFRAVDLGASVYVTIGAGGTAATATADGTNAFAIGNPGSDTTFGGHARALGGIAAASTSGSIPTGKSFLIGKTGGNGRGGGDGNNYDSVHGGGGGGGSAASVQVPGTSQFGGGGGKGVLSATSPASADAGVAPGGGGGGVRISINKGTTTSGPGASGAARISYW